MIRAGPSDATPKVVQDIWDFFVALAFPDIVPPIIYPRRLHLLALSSPSSTRQKLSGKSQMTVILGISYAACCVPSLTSKLSLVKLVTSNKLRVRHFKYITFVHISIYAWTGCISLKCCQPALELNLLSLLTFAYDFSAGGGFWWSGHGQAPWGVDGTVSAF